MGEVYLAEDTKLDRKVALKVLLPEVATDKDRLKRFVREAKAASALNHPNILTVYEIGSFSGSEYISTELIEGETLRERMKREPLSIREALQALTQVTAALSASHEAGIIHRDIKPENIMIRPDDLVKVLDFGLAKVSPLSAASIETTMPQINTKPGVIVGTIAYMSPEQARGRQIDPRSDIFSLGIVMFELFTGRRPFEGESQLELISSILKDDPPQLRQISPDLPRELERIVEKSLRKDLDHRYQHVKDLHIDLEDLDDELKFESKLHRSAYPTTDAIQLTNTSLLRSAFTTSISKTRRFTVLHAIIFMVLVASGVGAFWYLRPNPGPTAVNYKLREVASWIAAPGELFGTARFSPDGKMIAFASTRSGSKGIWLTQTNSTEAIPVTNDSFANTDPIWSPGGDELAYVSRRSGSDGTTRTSIWRISALGGGIPRTIGPVDDGSLELRRWTRSGKIYFELRGDLFALDVSTGGVQRVTSLAERKPNWISISDDEKRVIYATWENDRWQFYSSDVAGTQIAELGFGPGGISKPIAWSADTLFFAVVVDSATRIMSLGITSGEIRQISASEIEHVVVDSKPEAEALLLGGSKEESNLWRVDLADSRESPIARDLDAKLWPHISPDGALSVFQSIKGLSNANRLMSGSIVVKSAKPLTDSERPIPMTMQGFLPAWSPRGSEIAFLRRVGSQTELFVVNSGGGVERRLASFGNIGAGYSVSPYNLTETGLFSWSPDGTAIAYIAEKDGVSNLWSVSIVDGSESQITANTDQALTYHCPISSPDGKRIAYGIRRRGRDVNGKVIRGFRWSDLSTRVESAVLESSRITRLIGWTADSAALIAAEADKDNSGLPPTTSLIKISVSNMAETIIASLKTAYFYNIFLSYDKKQIAFAARDQNLDDLWVVPTSGGQPRKLTRNNDTGQFYSRMAWLPDGSAIIFGKQTRFSLLSIMTDIN